MYVCRNLEPSKFEYNQKASKLAFSGQCQFIKFVSLIFSNSDSCVGLVVLSIETL